MSEFSLPSFCVFCSNEPTDCPACGSQFVGVARTYDDGVAWHVECLNLSCCVETKKHKSMAEAIQEWNSMTKQKEDA